MGSGRFSEQLASAALNALSSHIAIVNNDGTIVFVNLAWTSFAAANGDPAQVGVGANYFEVCRRAELEGEAHAALFMDGAGSVLTGTRWEFAMEYPCHSTDEKRSFIVHVARADVDNDAHLVVTHSAIAPGGAQTPAARRARDVLRFGRQLDALQEDGTDTRARPLAGAAGPRVSTNTIRLRQTGFLTGAPKSTPLLELDMLAAEDPQMIAAIETIFLLSDSFVTGADDRELYSISVHLGARSRTVHIGSSAVPPTLRPLIIRLKRSAEFENAPKKSIH